MVEEKLVVYPIRFFIDEFFINDILKDKKKAIEVIQKLSKIHFNSRYYQREHNLILDESFKNAIYDKEIRGHALVGAMHPIPPPDFLKEETIFESKVIRCCIDLASKKPYQVFILTSEEQAKKYIENEHYKNDKVRQVISFVYGESAINLINVIFRVGQ